MRKMILALALLTLSHPLLAANIDLDKLKGDVVYVDFWASWCGPCRNSFPWMRSMQARYGDRGLKIIAINLDQEPQLARKFLRDIPATFQIEYDPKGKLADQFGVKAMPTSFLIDRSGKTRIRHDGFFEGRRAEYEDEIARLLKEHP